MKRILLLTVVALTFGVLAPTVHASLVLTLDDGVNPIVTVDDAIAPTIGDGIVTFSGGIGNWAVNITSGFSKPLIGTASEAVLHLNSVNVTGAAAGTLKITLTDDGYSLVPVPSGGTILTSEVSVTTNGTASFKQTWKDQYSADVILSHGPFVNGSFAETLTASVPYSGPFSLTEFAEITHARGGLVTSFDFESTVVPVPAAVLLGLLGLSAAGLKLRRFA